MIKVLHIVSHVTTACSSGELAESHVNTLLGWQSRTLSHRGEARRGIRKYQVATHPLSHLIHRLPLNNYIRRVRVIDMFCRDNNGPCDRYVVP
jgi:hypothetical protein